MTNHHQVENFRPINHKLTHKNDKLEKGILTGPSKLSNIHSWLDGMTGAAVGFSWQQILNERKEGVDAVEVREGVLGFVRM